MTQGALPPAAETTAGPASPSLAPESFAQPQEREATATAGQSFWLWLALVAVALTCCFINPFREAAVDDDWAYALTVQHLLDTGHYQLNDWAAANMPFQIYWGGLFAKLLGYSQATLRLSTLVVVFVGLIAFYYLAREHGLTKPQAAVTMLGLISSPLVLHFSFSFMTDVPFMMWVIIALLLYTWALRRHSLALMLLGSVAGACAILIRQFGIALIAGLVVTWLLGKDRKGQFLLIVAGIALPVAAAAWQMAAARWFPNWTAGLRLYNQREFMADVPLFGLTTFWRCAVTLVYLALFSLPLVFLAAPTFLGSVRAGARRPGWLPGDELTGNLLLLVLMAALIVGGIALGSHVNQQPRHLMPFLEWNFDRLLIDEFTDKPDLGKMVRLVVTVVGVLGGVLFGAVVVRRYLPLKGWHELSPGQRLLDLTTLFLLGLHLIYAQFGDEYLIALLPYTFLVLGRHLRNWFPWLLAPAAVSCLVMLAVSAIWTRGLLQEEEAQWTVADRVVRETGAKPEQVFGSWAWNCYHGAFEDYLKDIDHKPVYGTLQEGFSGLKDFFVRYLDGERLPNARYVVKTAPVADGHSGGAAENTAKGANQVPFRDQLFRKQIAYVETRAPVQRRRGFPKPGKTRSSP